MNEEPCDSGQEFVIERLRRVGGQVVVWSLDAGDGIALRTRFPAGIADPLSERTRQ
jgi:hypothetical protein